MILRLVGFLEYSKALENFDQLLSLASESELKELDAFVRGKDEFTVFTDISRRVPQGNSLLQPQGNGDRARRGLDWVVALARVEVGAMLAAYSNYSRPFSQMSKNGYELDAYRELIVDGLRMHYWALANDDNLGSVSRRQTVGTETLAYSRRLVLARAFQRAARALAPESVTPQQIAELDSWKKNLDSIQGGFVSKIQSYLETVTQKTKQTQQNEFTMACGALLRAEQRERAAGTASIKDY